jgi:hypothetical protein
MTIVRCPRCRDEVTLPEKASPRALVRCPLCLEEYLLAEALADAPPSLIIIGGEVPAEVLAPPGSGLDEPQASVEYRLTEGDGSPGPGSADASGMPAEIVSGSIALGPGTGVRPATRVVRPRRPEKSAVAEAVKIVAGGVIGLALGLLVLWWGFRRDPLELGPTFAPYVPWLVPSQFRGGAPARSGEAAAPDTSGPTTSAGASAIKGKPQRRTAQNRNESSGRQRSRPEDELQTLPLLEEPSTRPAAVPELSLPLELPSEPPAKPNARPSDRSEPLADAIRTPSRPPADAASRPSAQEPSQDEAGKEPRKERASPPMPDLRDLLDLSFPTRDEESPLARLLPASPIADTLAAVAASEAALRDYEALPRDDAPGRQKAFAAWYATLCQAAQTLGAVAPEDEDPHARQSALHALLDHLEGSTGKRSAAAHLTIQTWPQASHGQGLLAVGRVGQCFEQGPPYRLLLEIRVRDQSLTLPLVLGTRPSDFCQTDDELIVLGRVIEQPHERLTGYADEHPKALWVCLARRVPLAP